MGYGFMDVTLNFPGDELGWQELMQCKVGSISGFYSSFNFFL